MPVFHHDRNGASTRQQRRSFLRRASPRRMQQDREATKGRCVRCADVLRHRAERVRELGGQLSIPGVHSLVSTVEVSVARPLTPVSVAGAIRRCAAAVWDCEDAASMIFSIFSASRLKRVLASSLMLNATFPLDVSAETATASKPATGKPFNTEQLDALVASIALYPDELPTQVLMPSTFPLEVVRAARWVEAPRTQGAGRRAMGAEREVPGAVPGRAGLASEKWRVPQ
jgi:Protein of unknown function (DUF3300)